MFVVGRLQRERQGSLWGLETRQRAHWRYLGGLQDSCCCFKSLLFQYLEDEQAPSSADLHGGHGGLPLSLRGKCLPRKSGLFSCFDWRDLIKRPQRKPNRERSRSLIKANRNTDQLQTNFFWMGTKIKTLSTTSEKAFSLVNQAINNTELKNLD